MRNAPPSTDESQRLQTLAEYGLSPDGSQDEVGTILKLATSIFNVPTALLSAVDEHRQIFAARIGIDVCETNKDVSFCAHALREKEILLVPDASLDPRFQRNPLVMGEPFIRFYAGVPLRAPSGHAIGTLCIIDKMPNHLFSDMDRKNLQSLARLALDKLEIRRLERAKQDGHIRFEKIAATSPDAIVCSDDKGTITFWNTAAQCLFGFRVTEAEGQSIDIIVPDRLRNSYADYRRRVIRAGSAHVIGKTVELLAQRKDGTEFPIELSLSVWSEKVGTSFGSVMRDITERRADQDRLHRLAHFDPLTDLPNRMVLKAHIEKAIKNGKEFSILILDLDSFKEVNDTLGHSSGDALLKLVAERLQQCMKAGDVIARFGGDEFAVFCLDTNNSTYTTSLADRMIACLSKPFEIEGEIVYVSGSVGLAMSPVHGTETDDLLSASDLALYRAKTEGKNCWKLFSPDLRCAAITKRSYQLAIRKALEKQEFEVFYQPQVDAISGDLIGAEALIRWRSPQQGLIQPGAFLWACENTRMAMDLGEWVLRTACAQASTWRRQGAPNFRVAVNLFNAQFLARDLLTTVRTALREFNLPASALELELTENIILRHDEAMLLPLSVLREDGVGIALDDFGTGYASLSILKRFAFTKLKIDKSFVRNLCQSAEDRAIVRAVISLGRSFGMDVVAEGVEDQEQRKLLVGKGCNEIQGFLFGRPMPSQEFEVAFNLNSEGENKLCVTRAL